MKSELNEKLFSRTKFFYKPSNPLHSLLLIRCRSRQISFKFPSTLASIAIRLHFAWLTSWARFRSGVEKIIKSNISASIIREEHSLRCISRCVSFVSAFFSRFVSELWSAKVIQKQFLWLKSEKLAQGRRQLLRCSLRLRVIIARSSTTKRR